METKQSLEFKLNELQVLDLNQVYINMPNLPQYADKATAEAALDVGQAYINTTTGAVGIALA